MTTTTPQHMEALKRANEVRFANAQAKRHVRALPTKQEARAAVAAMLLAPTPELEREHLQRLLLAVPGVGPAKFRRLALVAGASTRARVGELTERQRVLLARTVGGLGT